MTCPEEEDQSDVGIMLHVLEDMCGTGLKQEQKHLCPLLPNVGRLLQSDLCLSLAPIASLYAQDLITGFPADLTP
jgi:hypothetical protein